jgi:hypothetical protein
VTPPTNADYFRRHRSLGLPWVVSKIVIDSPCSCFRFTAVVGSNEDISVRSNSAIDQIGVGVEQGHGGAFFAQAFNGPVEGRVFAGLLTLRFSREAKASSVVLSCGLNLKFRWIFFSSAGTHR